MRFKGISISDLHVGYDRIPHNEMISVLLEFILSQLVGSKVLFICGDLFDRPLSLANNSTFNILSFIETLLDYCDENDITVRVLRGTYGHDRIQSEYFMELGKRNRANLDIKYFDKIDVEYIEKLDISIGYIPDDLPYKSSGDAICAIKEKMTIKGLTKLDYVLAHGYFQHVLPLAAHPKIVFTNDQFSFVKKCVFVGHVHQHSCNKNIYYNGSVNRLAFNEEEPKGLLSFINKNDTCEVTFIENKNAHIFKTFDYNDVNEDDIIDRFRKDIQPYIDIRQTVFIRVIHTNAIIRAALNNYVLNKHHNIIFVHLSKNKKTSITETTDIKLDVIPTKNYSLETLPNDIKDGLIEHKLTQLSTQEITDILADFI